MCTVVIEIPHPQRDETHGGPSAVRVLAVRDEDPARPWDAPGEWWPEHPGVVGVRDRLAGGAWLAASSHDARLAILLNRADETDEGAPPAPRAGLLSRGTLPLAAVSGAEVSDPPGTAAFNLLAVHGGRASVTAWNGIELTRSELGPGIHMLAHHDVDDEAPTPRIATWLPRFRALGELPDDEWQRAWIDLLEESSGLSPDDDRAIIRDNRTHGYPTLSLLACLAEVRAGGSEAEAPSVSLRTAVLDRPGVWGHTRFGLRHGGEESR